LKFADDTKIFSRIEDDNDRKAEALQDDLSKLITWSEKWQMLFNTRKCKVMHVGKTQKQFPYYMNSQQLEEVIQEKDPGILISNDLKVSQQCQAGCSQLDTGVNSTHGQLDTTRHKRQLKSIYSAI